MFETFERFTSAQDYAAGLGYISGIPNFHQANHGQGEVMGTFLFRENAVSWQDVPRSQLNGANRSNIPTLFTEVTDWCRRNGAAGGYPNCHQTDYGAGPVQGVVIFQSHAIEWRDVSRATLGNPQLNDVGAMMRSAHDYAVANGFLTGIPTFHHADYGHGVVYGINLVKRDFGDWRDVFENIFHIYLRFTFASGITVGERDRLRARHAFAYERIHGCGDLTSAQRESLITTYRRNIHHTISTNANANAEAVVGGSSIAVNFSNLFSEGDTEIAQTLIHEMMHCAGFSHPNRRNRDPSNPTVPFDSPGDNGPYYGTPPLQAEVCIAGIQSLIASENVRACSPVGNTYVIGRQ